MENNSYIIRFVVILCVAAALLIAGLHTFTKDIAEQNEDIFNKRAVLSAIESKLGEGVKVDDFSDEEILDIFDKQVQQFVIKTDGSEVDGFLAEDIEMEKEEKKSPEEMNLPLFAYSSDQGKFYIVTVRGNGLWDKIWGYIALEGDLNTIAGASFDHKGETPGLGAEIKDNPGFAKAFRGKQVYNGSGEFVSVNVRKPSTAIRGNEAHEVDAIGGATVTCDGVTDMLFKGIQFYEAYFKKIKES